MSKFFDFTTLAGGPYNEKLRKELVGAIGSEDTLIVAGYTPVHERSREVNRAVERAILGMERPLGGLVIADEGLSLDDAYIQQCLNYGVFFWEFEALLNAQAALVAWEQAIGDCVSFGMARAVNDVLCIEVVNSGQIEVKPADVATETIYAGSRVEIGGGRLSGDGSIGAWAAKYVTDYGIHLRLKYGSHDLGTYSGSRARQWGGRGAGVPNDIEQFAKEHPVGETTLVTTGANAQTFLCHLNPITIASNQGFSRRRNKDGTCDPVGSWAHQMFLRGICRLKGGKIIVIIQNSWADYLGSANNVIVTESGREVTLPQGAFGCELGTLESRILRQEDSFAVKGIRGWRSTARERKALADIYAGRLFATPA
jgi:hypothetical protein